MWKRITTANRDRKDWNKINMRRKKKERRIWIL
jgi:hypothetical protein